MGNNSKDEHRYDHIIDFEYPYPTHRKKMSMVNRGAQFAPFAALTGHDSAIIETARLTDTKIDLSDEQITRINERLNLIQSLLPDTPIVYITYFVKDDKKDGGSYITDKCEIRKIDEYDNKLIMKDKSTIFIEDIIEITGDLFNEYDSL